MRFPFSLLLAALPLAGISVSPTVAFSAKANEERASLSVQPQTLEELRLADPLEIAKLDKYDSRLYDIVTPIKKQQLDICWSYATMAASETSILREGLFSSETRNLDLSELNHAYRSFNNDPDWDPLRLTTGDAYRGDYDAGYHLRGSGQKMLSWATPNFEPYWETTPEVKPADFLLEDIIRVDYNDRDDIKRAIARYGAVTVTYSIYDWHEQYYYYNGNIRVPNHHGRDHAVTIVGWDDTVDKNLYKLPASLDGGWIVKNSWGTAHAEGDGYFMLSYDSPIVDTYAFDFASKDEYDFNYHYDGFIETDDYIANNEPTAAIFPAKKGSLGQVEYLKAVNVTVTDTVSPKQTGEGTIKARVYVDVPADEADIYSAKNDPAPAGKLTATIERKIDHEGSYTLELPGAIPLENGAYFSVVVEVESANDKYKVTLSSEAPASMNDLTFYQNGEGKWVNCGSPLRRQVARIKAFTKCLPRVHAVEKDLKYADIRLDSSFSPRYGALTGSVPASLTSEGATLREGVDYAFLPIDVRRHPDPTGTSSDYDIVATGTLTARGLGEWRGEISAVFPILVGMHDLSALGEVAPDNTVRIAANAVHRVYADLPLPEGWSFLFPDDALSLGENEGNYVQYVAEDELCYRRNMYPVIVEKTDAVPETIDLSSAEASLRETSFVYSGAPHQPGIDVSLAGKNLALNRDYRLQYRDNLHAGTGSVDILGIGGYHGKKTLNFRISPAPIEGASLELEGEHSYTGAEIRPPFTLSFAGKTLREGEDFVLSYADNVNAGNGKIIVDGQGDFQGRREISFAILRAENRVEHLEIVDGQPRAEALFGEVKYAYYADASCQEEIAKPTAPGTYYVKAYVEGNDNYAGAESAPLRFPLLENGSGEVDPPLPPEEEEPTQEGIGNGWILALSISLPALALLAALLVCFFRRRKK